MSRLKSSRNSGFSSRVVTILPNSCLIWDSWTLCMGIREVRGMLPGKKNRNLRLSNCWKFIEIVNPTTTTVFLYHLKFLRSHQTGLLALGTAHPPPPPPACLRACDPLYSLLPQVKETSKKLRAQTSARPKVNTERFKNCVF